MDQKIMNEPTPPTNTLHNLTSSKQAAGDMPGGTADLPPWSGSGRAKPPEELTEAFSPQANKEQLHQRVDTRMGELEAALSQLDGQLANGERSQAISAAMDTARNSMSGGWERVGEIEAAQLSQWLGVTEDLRVTSPGLKAIDPS